MQVCIKVVDGRVEFTALPLIRDPFRISLDDEADVTVTAVKGGTARSGLPPLPAKAVFNASDEIEGDHCSPDGEPTLQFKKGGRIQLEELQRDEEVLLTVSWLEYRRL